jgi:thiamine-phosphate pyrophosphorylase
MRKLEGIYLIADASIKEEILLPKIEEALENGVKLLQLYSTRNHIAKLLYIKHLCSSFEALLLISNDWKLALELDADGVHFDQIPADIKELNQVCEKNFIKGLTLGNDLQLIEQAHEHDFDYFSFCSMFPSPSAGDCEIVTFESVQKAKVLTSLPLFAAGGINLTNIERLAELPIDGVAAISSIMEAEDVGKATQLFNAKLEKLKKR